MLGMTVLSASRLQAQSDSTSCEGRRVDSIEVTTAAPTVEGMRRFPIVGTVSRAFHTTTRESVIRNFMLLRVGDLCTDLRRAESERILRAQPFIADASVVAQPSPSGGVVLIVHTTDEVALVLGGTVISRSPYVRALKLGNSNIAGTSSYLAGSWHDGDPGYRDAFGLQFQHSQILGRPYTFDLEAERRSLGDRYQVESSHPFFTDLQRIAWRVRSGSSVDYITFPSMSTGDTSTFPPVPIDHALFVTRRFFDIGGVVRIGPPGRLTLLGASLTGDEDLPSRSPVIIGPAGLVADVDPRLSNRYTDHHMARANVLWGVRDLTFKSRRGVDALTAVQDVPAGFQLGTMFGRSLSVLGSRDDDLFLASDLYLGVIGRYSGFRLQMQGEGRRANDSGSWDGILTTGRASQYIHASDRNALSAAVEWSGGWHERIPFNVSLADPRDGVRGFSNSRLVGAQRLVGRLESRWLLGPVSPYGDLGFAIFGDVGKLYAGDVPFGTPSPVATSAGVSLLGAAPRGSARLFRMDLAVALRGNPAGRRVELRLTTSDNTRFFYRQPDDIERTRERTVPSSVFRWP
jgi:hypothetical protein